MAEGIQINAPLGLNALAIKCNDPGMPVRELDPGDSTKVYENTSGILLDVCVTVTAQGSFQGSGLVYIAPPKEPYEDWEWMIVGAHHVDAYGYAAHHIHGSITFLVPPGYYYKVGKLAYCGLLHWFEWYMFVTKFPEEGGAAVYVDNGQGGKQLIRQRKTP